MARKRYERKKPLEAPRRFDPEFHKHATLFSMEYARIVKKFGRSAAEALLRDLTYEPSKSDWKLMDKILLVERLLCMPGDRTKYKLAQEIAAKSGKDPKTVMRTIDDAIAAVRRMQEAEGNAAILEIGDDGEGEVKTKYGIKYCG